MIIFFVWATKARSVRGQRIGTSGIVEKIEHGIVYIVKGNSDDSCHIKHYSVEYYAILEFGIQQY